jgi:hypothetical protein
MSYKNPQFYLKLVISETISISENILQQTMDTQKKQPVWFI